MLGEKYLHVGLVDLLNLEVLAGLLVLTRLARVRSAAVDRNILCPGPAKLKVEPCIQAVEAHRLEGPLERSVVAGGAASIDALNRQRGAMAGGSRHGGRQSEARAVVGVGGHDQGRVG
jgi:hypothetical protein